MGKCPHCGSGNIRRRYSEHRRYKWRCRNCNEVFRAPSRGVAIWIGVVAVVVVAAAGVLFAVQQGVIALPSTPAELEESVDRVVEVVMPTATSVEPIATITTTLQSVSAQVVSNASKVQATIDANARSIVTSESVAMTATSTPTPAPVSAPIIASTPVPTLIPKLTPTPAPVPSPHLRYIAEKQYMLELINAAREDAGVPAVELGDNIAAQLHAESALANCFSSHWGIDGLTPYMRYSLAGGYQSNGENGSGLDYCYIEKDRVAGLNPMRQEMADSVKGFMGSPGHRDNLLYKHHKKVNIGIARDRYNLFIYQHFEGDHIEYDVMPIISADGILTLSGKIKNGAVFSSEGDLGVHIYYDQPPRKLTRGQVSRTYCYGNGLPVASLRRPLTGGSYWPSDTFTIAYNPCPDPYDVPPNAPAARSSEHADELWEEAYKASEVQNEREVTASWITGTEWLVTTNSFKVTADLIDVLENNGKGVYTVNVWAWIDGERTVISEYSIFHGITPPDAYTPH